MQEFTHLVVPCTYVFNMVDSFVKYYSIIVSLMLLQMTNSIIFITYICIIIDCPWIFSPNSNCTGEKYTKYPRLVGTLKFPPVQDNFKILSWTGLNFIVPTSPGLWLFKIKPNLMEQNTG